VNAIICLFGINLVKESMPLSGIPGYPAFV
jgi:hypothetical protein